MRAKQSLAVVVLIALAALLSYRLGYKHGAQALSLSRTAASQRSTGVFVGETHPYRRNVAPPQESSSADWWASTNSPVIELWEGGGLPVISKPPIVIFAAWADGMVVRAVDGRLQRGDVPPQEIRKLMNEVQAAGFLSPPLPYGLTHPDGPLRRLAVMRNGQLVYLDYDGDSDFRDVGPRAGPSRQQMEGFVKMWQRVVRAIDMLPSGQLRDFQGERELRFPRG